VTALQSEWTPWLELLYVSKLTDVT
jgi:hypothetical protein